MFSDALKDSFMVANEDTENAAKGSEGKEDQLQTEEEKSFVNNCAEDSGEESNNDSSQEAFAGEFEVEHRDDEDEVVDEEEDSAEECVGEYEGDEEYDEDDEYGTEEAEESEEFVQNPSDYTGSSGSKPSEAKMLDRDFSESIPDLAHCAIDEGGSQQS